MRLSILDRAVAAAGHASSDVLGGVVEHARRAEALGFHRFLVAEHHGVPGIPGSQPTVLATAVAARTRSIRVGTGGIMLPAHQPFVVAEQIGVLEALFPGRIDAGIGSSVGFTAPVRSALRQDDVIATKARFDADLAELLGYLRGEGDVAVNPPDGSRTPVWLLANFRSLLVAARHGLGVIVGGPSVTDGPQSGHEGLRLYREQFQPSELWPAPVAIASVNVAVADTASAARDLLLPQAWAEARSRATGVFEDLRPARDLDPTLLTARERSRIDESLSMSIHGTPHEVRDRLAALTARLGVDEVLVTGDMADPEGRARSEELLAELSA